MTDQIKQLEERIAAAIGVAYCVTAPVGEGDLLALRVLGDAALGERALMAGEEMLVSARDAQKVGDVLQKVGVLPSVYAQNTARALENALSPASRAVMLTHVDGKAQKTEAVRNFCNAYDLWLLERMECVWGIICDFEGVPYKAGVVGDLGVGTLCDAVGEPICDYLCTKDALPAQLARMLRTGQITEAAAVRGLQFLK